MLNAIAKSKRHMRRILIILITISMITGYTSPVSAASKPAVNYTSLGPVGMQVYMGAKTPGSYLISTSSVPDAAINIIDKASAVCHVVDFFHVGKYIPGCSYISIADWFVSYKPGARFQVWLYDAKSGKQVWTGYLDSGATLYLGNDHPNGYKVYFATTKLADAFIFEALVQK